MDAGEDDEDEESPAGARWLRFYHMFIAWIAVTVGLAIFGFLFVGGNCELGPPFCVERAGFSLTSGDLLDRVASGALLASGLLFVGGVALVFGLRSYRRRKAVFARGHANLPPKPGR